MIKVGFFALLIMVSFSSLKAANLDRINKLKWNDLDVVWLEDDRFPTYDIMIYFGDGSLSDANSQRGITNAMFSSLGTGTKRYTQKDIADVLEFFGVSHGGSVTHEYSSYSFSGLVKDIIPTAKMICHLFNDADFPKKEIKKEKNRAINSIKNLVNSHGALASRAFRELSLSGTPFNYPVSGKIKDIKKISRKKLLSKLQDFNQNVKKRIYLAGPKDVLSIEKIITEQCGWTGKASRVRKVDYKVSEMQKGPTYHLVTVPKANQAQVRIGRFLDQEEIKFPEKMELASSYLGGGFTSKLMIEIRQKRGLSYTVSAFAAGQKEYGRAAISTFTKVPTVPNLLNVVWDTLVNLGKGEVTDEEFERARGHLVGSYPFRFEQSAAYMGQLMALDHAERSYDELVEFPKKLEKLSKAEIIKEILALYSPGQQTVVVLGPKKLKSELKKLGKVKVHSYKSFL